MPVSAGAPSSSNLVGLPLHTLKAKAAVVPDNTLPLLHWINTASHVYHAALDADARQASELAYVQYFKAAGSVPAPPPSRAHRSHSLSRSVLQLILKHPDFSSMKAQQPATYRIYQGQYVTFSA